MSEYLVGDVRHESVKIRRQAVWALVLIFLVLIPSSVWVFNNLYTTAKKSAQDQLVSIATLKTQQLEEWIDDRYSDAQTLGVDSYFSMGVERWLNSGRRNDLSRTQIHQQLESFVIAHHFNGIALFDQQGEWVLHAGDEVLDVHPLRSRIQEAMTQGQIEFVDLHWHERDAHPPAVGFIVPLQVEGRIIGALYFVESASRYLFPLLSHWPSDSQTAETLLVREENGQVLFLSHLRKEAAEPLSLSFTMTDNLASAQAIKIKKGLMEGVPDYVGQSVLAFASPIKGTSWV